MQDGTMSGQRRRMDSANNDRATLYINRHFRRRVTERQLRQGEREGEKERERENGVIEKVMAVCALTGDRLIPLSRRECGHCREFRRQTCSWGDKSQPLCAVQLMKGQVSILYPNLIPCLLWYFSLVGV